MFMNFLASAVGYREIVEFLIENGVSLDKRDNDGDTAITLGK